MKRLIVLVIWVLAAPPTRADMDLAAPAEWLQAMLDAPGQAGASDPEPSYLMGVALAQMDRLPEAQYALECSLAIESRLRNPNAPPSRSTLAAANPGAPCSMGAPTP